MRRHHHRNNSECLSNQGGEPFAAFGSYHPSLQRTPRTEDLVCARWTKPTSLKLSAARISRFPTAASPASPLRPKRSPARPRSTTISQIHMGRLGKLTCQPASNGETPPRARLPARPPRHRLARGTQGPGPGHPSTRPVDPFGLRNP